MHAQLRHALEAAQRGQVPGAMGRADTTSGQALAGSVGRGGQKKYDDVEADTEPMEGLQQTERIDIEYLRHQQQSFGRERYSEASAPPPVGHRRTHTPPNCRPTPTTRSIRIHHRTNI